MTAQQATGQEKSDRLEPRGSIKAKRRSGSVASSSRRKTEKSAAPAAVEEEKVAESFTANQEKPKKRGVSKFLSFLNCCGTSKNAPAVELGDLAVPAKKAKGSQSTRIRQTTPVTKLNTNAMDPSTGESKEAIEENIGGPPYSELPPATKPKIGEPPKKDIEKTENPFSSSIGLPSQGERADSAGTEGQPSSSPPDTSISIPQQATTQPHGAEGSLQPSITISPTSQQDTPEQDMTINDRTPQQEKLDTDVEMTDAPPAAPVPDSQSTGRETKDENQSQVTLPPPPPRAAQDRPAIADRRTSNGVTPGEQQKWLLPPMHPRFRGKKCLVLDLDETLVHSSFKVCKYHFIF